MTTISAMVFVLSLLAFSGFFFIYPLMILAASIFRYKKQVFRDFGKPFISMIIVVRNGEDLILKKIENAMSIEYPSDQYEIIIYSDGSTDRTVETVKPFLNNGHGPTWSISAPAQPTTKHESNSATCRYFHINNIHLYKSEEHAGKFLGLNKAVAEAKGDIIFFSDADAILDRKAVVNMAKHFSDPQIGGVCGRRVIGEHKKSLAEAQGHYFSFDAWTKKTESRAGSITSNDGKLFAIRRELFSPVPPGVTDDLYMALNIIKKKKRFVFEADALAFIRLPSRSVKHEIERRKRIVSTSLMGIFLMRDLLNPFEYGLYSLKLFLNKILRRLLPVFLVLLFASNLYISFYKPFYVIPFFFQVIFYSMALIYPLIFQKRKDCGIVSRASSIIFYFCIGNIGVLFGVFNFLMGKRIVKWTPIKNDSQEGD